MLAPASPTSYGRNVTVYNIKAKTFTEIMVIDNILHTFPSHSMGH